MNRRWLLVVFFLGGVPPLSAAFLSRDYTVPELKEKIAKLPASGRESTKARFLTDLGIALYRDNKLDEAIQALQEAADLGVRSGLARQLYRYLGKCYETLGRLDKSVEAYEMAVTYDPKNWKRHRDLGRMYRRAKLDAKAAGAYLHAIALNPKKAELYFALGQTYYELGLYHLSDQNLVKSLDLGQNHNEVFHELSFVYEKMGRFEEAADSWNEGIKEHSPTPDICRLIYLAYLAQNDGMAKNALNLLVKKSIPQISLHYYESLVQSMNRPPAKILISSPLHP